MTNKPREVVNKESPSNTSNVSVNEYRANVTTVIHLNNVINNTHVIEVPVSINYTNQQNISLHSGGYSDDVSGNSTDKCCIVISPRQCVPHKEYPFIRCFHYRSRQCGDYCTASIIHKEQRQVCQSIYPGAQPNCYQQIIYIPQPQPRCTYQSSWPYVACGIQKSASCSGCYNHYVNENSKAYTTCPTGCYDEGFGIGPYYRQGPVYRPTYFHTPPCFQCDSFGAYGGNGGYAGYGGYAGPVGYGGGYGGFPPVGIPGFGTGTPQLPEMSLGSWSPGEVNSFGTGNQSTFNSSDIVSFDPLISVGPGFSNPMGYIDPFRASREVEIEVDYEPPSSVQAEVKIQTNKTEEQGMTSDEIRKASTPS
ncbi:hypothetical protein NQ314_012284 [Rhamnusium bicolor]|uniref:Uncharacterized protein n=1 Tax=Rhamnusium bicolor TaxID=1586634 RepID=A0AAV8XDK0_9CUCU|nr:hypothetical protein NQ314_012284 [Rhamnusium bicolor]